MAANGGEEEFNEEFPGAAAAAGDAAAIAAAESGDEVFEGVSSKEGEESKGEDDNKEHRPAAEPLVDWVRRQRLRFLFFRRRPILIVVVV